MFRRLALCVTIIVILADWLPESLADQCGDTSRPLGIELLSRPSRDAAPTNNGINVASLIPCLFQIRTGENGQPDTNRVRLIDLESPVQDRAGIVDVFPLFTGDPSLWRASPVSDVQRPMGLVLTVDYDAFRGISDGSWENNGIRIGFNFATRLGTLSELTGIGFQVGSSIGMYDWAGTDYRLMNAAKTESQGFVTYGFYRKPDESSRIVGALVQDWMFNSVYGMFGENPTLSQLRGQVGYAISASNEFGIWGTAHVLSSVINVPTIGATKWQSVNQLSGYWHHKWSAYGADTWISVGVPENDRLAGGGNLGDYLVTATASCPLNDVVSVVSSVTYMHQSGRSGGDSSYDEAWNFSVGISICPRRNARSATVAGQRWMPLLPVANNGSFLVDTSKTY